MERCNYCQGMGNEYNIGSRTCMYCYDNGQVPEGQLAMSIVDNLLEKLKRPSWSKFNINDTSTYPPYYRYGDELWTPEINKRYWVTYISNNNKFVCQAYFVNEDWCANKWSMAYDSACFAKEDEIIAYTEVIDITPVPYN